MRIAVDAMGGDFAPHEIIEGAILAQTQLGVDIALVGDRDVLANYLKQHNNSSLSFIIDIRILTGQKQVQELVHFSILTEHVEVEAGATAQHSQHSLNINNWNVRNGNRGSKGIRQWPIN